MGKLCMISPIPGINTPGRMKSIIGGLFPVHHYKDTKVWSTRENFTLVTEVELRQAARSLKTNKAPGIPGTDGVLNEILEYPDFYWISTIDVLERPVSQQCGKW